MRKRLITCIISLLLLITCIVSLLLITFTFVATDGVQKSEVVDGIKWLYTVEDEGAIIGESSERYKYYLNVLRYYEPAIPHDTAGAITIPTTLGGFPVIAIGEGAFGDCSHLTNITIHEGIKKVHFYAFRGCSGLTSITIPTSVTSIGYGAFQSCSGLTKLMIPKNVTSIEGYAFSNCSGLTNITIPASVTKIGRWAFQGCSSLTSIDVEEGNTVYASVDGVLFNKTLSQIVRWPEGKKGALTIPASMTTIAGDAFYNCSGLTSIDVEEGNTAYASVDGVLFDKTLSQVVRYPGGKMGTFTLPASVKGIDRGAFDGCSSLTSIDVAEGNTAYASVDGVLLDKTLNRIVRCPEGKVGAFTIPASMTKIDHGAFRDCSRLTSITIAEGVTSIGNRAFWGYSGLTSITIPESVTSIGGYAFWDCSSLTSVTIPGSVTSIMSFAFYGCSSLTSITIPKSVTSIGGYAFANCSRLMRIDVAEENMIYMSADGILFDKAMSHVIKCPEGRMGGIMIPEGTTSIEESAFSGCSGLTSIMIPEGVTSIGSGAFSGCSGLTSIMIPEGVTSIRYHAFRGCSGLTSITIPESVTSIEMSAFSNCSALRTLTFEGDAPRDTHDSTFEDTHSDLVIYYDEDTTGWRKPWWRFSSNRDSWRGIETKSLPARAKQE